MDAESGDDENHGLTSEGGGESRQDWQGWGNAITAKTRWCIYRPKSVIFNEELVCKHKTRTRTWVTAIEWVKLYHVTCTGERWAVTTVCCSPLPKVFWFRRRCCSVRRRGSCERRVGSDGRRATPGTWPLECRPPARTQSAWKRRPFPEHLPTRGERLSKHHTILLPPLYHRLGFVFDILSRDAIRKRGLCGVCLMSVTFVYCVVTATDTAIYLLRNANKKSYPKFRMVPFSITVSDLAKYSTSVSRHKPATPGWAVKTMGNTLAPFSRDGTSNISVADCMPLSSVLLGLARLCTVAV